MKTGLSPIPRPDLYKDSPDFESIWVEAENSIGKNYLLCCVYRHSMEIKDLPRSEGTKQNLEKEDILMLKKW